ncbi:hypothetical protein PIIN_10028 [Serendipita indica DSM 11827]|uniref:Uncharacterized protein n=1 Tax=Serendipita indica (strain DSM 11827) TaxID=1109443 RepID=G4TXI5_SERID|nr:hypothetical protein PIIN_10028 [Serendipita indica DSM 11827]
MPPKKATSSKAAEGTKKPRKPSNKPVSVFLRIKACGIDIASYVNPESKKKAEMSVPDVAANRTSVNDTPSTGQPRAFASETLVSLLFFLSSFSTLRNLILTGHVFYDYFVAHREQVFDQILHNCFGSQAFAILRLSSLIIHERSYSPKIHDGNQWLKEYQPKYNPRMLSTTKWVEKIMEVTAMLYLTRDKWLAHGKAVAELPYVSIRSCVFHI